MKKNDQILYDIEVTKNKNMLRSHYNFSALDQKIISLAFAKLDKNMKKCVKEGVKIESTDLVNYLGVDPANIYSQMHESSKHLVSSYIDIYDDEKKAFIVLNLFKTSYYRNGTMLLHFSDDAIQMMSSGVKIQYFIGNFKKLQSRYSVRVYEILRSYLGDDAYPYDGKQRKYIELDLEEFRHMTGTTYMEDGKQICRYKNAGDFKIKVLDVADREINAYADINSRYLLIKKGKSFKTVGFWISSKMDDSDFKEEIHDNPDLKAPDIIESRPKQQYDFSSFDSLLEDLKGLKIIQLKQLLEITDEATLRFVYAFLTKDGDYSNLYARLLEEL